MNWYIEVLAKYATFSGRARRKEYWMFALCNAIVIIGLIVAIKLARPLAFVVPIYQLGTFLPTLAVGVRRMHDLGRSGWWIICPFVNIVFLVLEGEPKANAYGPNPKDAQPVVAS